MKTQLVLVMMLLACLSTKAQHPFDLKWNLLSTIGGRYEFAGEYLLSSNRSVEFGIGYEKDAFFNNSDLDTSAISGDTRGDLIAYCLNYRYYVKPRTSGDRFFVGGILHYNQNIGNQEYTSSLYPIFEFGVEPGFKWVLKKRLIVEIGMPWLVSFEKYKSPYESYTYLDYNLYLNGKIGFRFQKNTQKN